MFAAWGRLVYRWRWPVLALSGLLLLASVAALVRGGTLTSGSIEGIESDRADRMVEQALGRPGNSSFTVIFGSRTLEANGEPFQEAMRHALAPLRSDRHVSNIMSPVDVPPLVAATLISSDNHHALALITLRDEFRVASQLYPAIRSRIRSNVLDVHVTGHLSFKHDLDQTLESDLHRAEFVSMPLALIVLLLVFGTVVAAALPVGVGGLAVVGGVAAVMMLSRVTEMAQYTVNVVTLIGLGVAIDYSLFIVSRYRDELNKGASMPDALSVAMATAGRAVTFSGIAVGIGLAGLLFYRGSYLSAMGIAGTLVVVLAVLYALTFLPALLAVLGPRLNALRVPLPNIWGGEGVWHRIAAWVMRRPVLVLLPTLALVILIGSPFLRLQMAAADVNSLPRTTEARRGHEVLRRAFPQQVATRVNVVVRFPSAPVLTADRVGALFDLSRRLDALPGVHKVESVVDLDPSITRSDYVNLLTDQAAREGSPELGIAIRETVGDRVAVLSALTNSAPASEQARAIVHAIRADRRVGDGALLVTGQTAHDIDTRAFIVGRTPVAVGFVMGMTYLVLFLLLGSIILPLKAVLMNLLSIAGSFGALVWIFQEGHLSRLLGFEPAAIEPTLPVLLFCAVFGLSMDYEVLLLTRMQEEYLRTRDNTHAVAEGLERSGRLITSAAAIMVAVFAAFALADVVLIKAMGLGMAIAVALDATAVRVLIVPATMRLFGDLNWWAPRPLVRLYERIGIREAG